MLRTSMRTRLGIAGAVVATAMAIPAASQATEWTVNGLRSNASSQVAGLITLVPQGSTLRVSCFVNLTTTQTNTLTAANVSVSAASFSSCETNITGCTVTAAATSLPWTGNGSVVGTVKRINVTNVSFNNTFGSGCPAPLTSSTFSETGSLKPLFQPTTQSLLLDGTTATGTVTGPLGTATLSGGFDLQVTSPAGTSLGLQ